MKISFAMNSALSLAMFCGVLVSAAAAEDEQRDEELDDAVKEIVKVTDHGLEPATITFDKLDSSVFFVNETKDSLVTLTVDFGKLPAHCASGNMKFEDGKMKSIEPIGPKDFAIMCFPEKGTYAVKVDGVASEKIEGKVVVR